MKRLICMFLMLPQVLLAQTEVRVRSGEHQGFSRLVLQMEADSPWETVERSGEILITFPEQQMKFDLNSIFDRIPKTRIIDVSVDNSSDATVLTLLTPCACPVNIFPFRDNYIVIDVSDGGPLPDPILAATEPPDPAYEYWQPAQLRSITAAIDQHFFESPSDADLGAGQMVANERRQFDVPVDVMSSVDLATRTQKQDDPDTVARVAEAQEQLLRQLTRAADQGLIDFVTPSPTPEPEPETANEDVHEPEPDSSINQELLNQLSARTAYDVAFENDLSAIVNDFAKPHCRQNQDFRMNTWQSDESFATQLSDIRGGLYGEFDQINVDKANALVKLYLVNGLGAEAELILQNNENMSETDKVLLDMALVVDGRPITADGPIAMGENCGGDHEMWFLSSRPNVNLVMDTGSITEAFSNYPIEIRKIIGPELAIALLDANAPEAAQTVLEIVRRAGVDETSSLQLTQAIVLDATENPEDAGEILNQVAEAGGEEAMQAQLTIATKALGAENGIPETVLTDLQTIVFARRGTPTGAAARELEIQVTARVLGIRRALSLVNSDLQNDSDAWPNHHRIVWDIFEEAEANQQGPLAYSESVFQNLHLILEDAGADNARVKIAEQLTLIGLPNAAHDLLGPALARSNADAQMAAAKTYLAQFKPEQAIAAVADLAGHSAEEIRLAAFLQIGNDAGISDILKAPENAGLNGGNLAWRAGDWQHVSDDNAALAAYMLGQRSKIQEFGATQAPNDEDAFLTELAVSDAPNLQSARDLLAVNRASREFIEAALAAE